MLAEEKLAQILQDIEKDGLLRELLFSRITSLDWLSSQLGEEHARQLIIDLAVQLQKRDGYEQNFHQWEAKGWHVTPCHYYSPIPDTRELSDKLWETPSSLPGIDMREDFQLHLLKEIFPQYAHEYNQFPHDEPADMPQFYFNQKRFSGTDALVAYCMMRHYKPSLIVEVGSGVSTIIATQAAFLNGNTQVIAIEPYPNRFLNLVKTKLLKQFKEPVQDIPAEEFMQLKENDILFIDSSHVSKIGGDVNYLYLEILPRLNPGVIVHIHDIFLPFDMPRKWVMEQGRFWTEQYLLQAFLIGNTQFQVLIANGFLGSFHLQTLQEVFPNSNWWRQGGSFWMQKIA